MSTSTISAVVSVARAEVLAAVRAVEGPAKDAGQGGAARVVLEAGEDVLVVRATGREFAVSVRVPAQVSGEGVAVVEHAALSRALVAFAKGLGRGEAAGVPVSFELGETVRIGANDFVVPLPTMPASDAELEVPAAPAATHVVGREELLAAARQVKVCLDTAAQSMVPVLACVEVRLEPGAITMTATDRYRLGRVQVPAVGEDVGTALLHHKALAVIATHCEGESIAIGVDDERRLSVQAGALSVVGTSTAGEYPRVMSIIEKDRPHAVIVAREVLRAAVEQGAALVKALGQRSTSSLVLRCEAEQLQVLPVVDDEIQEGPGMPASVTGDPLEIALNATYLLEALSSIEGEQVRLGYEGPLKPVLFTAAEDDPDAPTTYRHVLQPVRRAGA